MSSTSPRMCAVEQSRRIVLLILERVVASSSMRRWWSFPKVLPSSRESGIFGHADVRSSAETPPRGSAPSEGSPGACCTE
eukprot:4730188-Pyramimonas_sp.AAC.1